MYRDRNSTCVMTYSCLWSAYCCYTKIEKEKDDLNEIILQDVRNIDIYLEYIPYRCNSNEVVYGFSSTHERIVNLSLFIFQTKRRCKKHVFSISCMSYILMYFFMMSTIVDILPLLLILECNLFVSLCSICIVVYYDVLLRFKKTLKFSYF